MTEYHVKIGKQGRITLPIEVRKRLGLVDGDTVVFDPIPGGFTLRKKSEPSPSKTRTLPKAKE